MAKRKRFALFLGIALICVAGAHVVITRASILQNMFGSAWSSNVGWFRLNDCDDPGTPSSCDAAHAYGMNIDQITGAISGYAWSSNVGWVSFNNTICPGNFNSPPCNPRVNWSSTADSDGGYKVQGWARACSVFINVTSCNGQLKAAVLNGGWDGFIALGDTNTTDAVMWGVKAKHNIGILPYGFAWGGDVVGWVNFTPVGGEVPFVDLTADPAEVASGGSSSLTVLTVYKTAPPTSCTGTIIKGGSGPWGPITLTQDPVYSDTWHSAPHSTGALTVDTTYQVECTFGDGKKGSDTAEVRIKKDPTGPSVDLTANRYLINAGDKVLLTIDGYNFTAPLTCTIDHGVGNVPMSPTTGADWKSTTAKGVFPTVTTTYTATCQGGNGSDDNAKTVVVKQDVPVENCTNKSDDDGDGYNDAQDPDCGGKPPQCNDDIDNDVDKLIDELDPGCWTKPNDPTSYNKDDNDETNKKPTYVEF